MNKEGWEVKKLGEIAEIEYGTRIVKKDKESTTYPVYGGGGITFYTDSYNREDRMVIGRFGLSPKCTRYIKGKFFLNDSGLTVKSLSSEISQNYIDTFLLCSNNKIYTLSRGAAQKNLDIKNFLLLTIPLPPLAIQEQIVKELDTLNDIIAKKKEQLAELDTLAQTTFYDMFGDPVDNEKGWNEAALGEIGVLERGKSKHRPRNAPELLGGRYPLIQTGEIANAGLYINEYTQTYSEFGLKQSKLWNKGTLCITIAANIAKTSILNFDACFPDSVVGFINNNKTNQIFIHYWFSFFQKILEEQAPEVAQKNINLKILNNLKVIIPPLSLQNQFAERIEAIEKQKELISKSIKEVQQLFDYTMDKYFN